MGQFLGLDHSSKEAVDEQVEQTVFNQEQIRGGLYGLLIGDAVGVPYEFHSAKELPSIDEIDMIPPVDFLRSHRSVPVGTWSDDGAQALCLLESLIECDGMNLDHFAQKMWAWYHDGVWAVDGKVFDVGIQTAASLRAYHSGVAPEKAGLTEPMGQGNGALMRVLPVALWHQGSDEELVQDASTQCLITHGHVVNQIACSLYCLWVRAIGQGASMEEGFQSAVGRLRTIYPQNSVHREELERTFRPDEEGATNGGGYVVETINSVRLAVRETSYEAVIKKAISLGNDTDTNAAIAGGLYGVKVGFAGIPQRWYKQLRAKERVEELLIKWFSDRTTME
jgi:ADP-ribosylglycohydrolase